MICAAMEKIDGKWVFSQEVMISFLPDTI